MFHLRSDLTCLTNFPKNSVLDDFFRYGMFALFRESTGLVQPVPRSGSAFIAGSFGERMGLPSRAHVPTTSRPAALAVHPETKEIVVATSRDCRLLLLDRAGRSCQDEPG